MGPLFQDKMTPAIGAIDLVLLAQGQENAGMAQSPIAAVASDARGFYFNYFSRLHDDAMSFNKHTISFGQLPP
jgi:hypothetical protein